MFTKIDNFLSKEQVVEWVGRLEGLPWEDGQRTALGASGRKINEQLTLQTPEAVPALEAAMRYIMQHPAVRSWGEPRRFSSIMFSRYGEGAHYGTHSDTCIQRFFGYPTRSDLSMTIFLNEPSDYEGGDLILESELGEVRMKPPAGTALHYNTGIMHRVEKVTSGARLVTIVWFESLIRHPDTRDVLRDIRKVIDLLGPENKDGEEVATLRRTYEQIMRMFAET